MEEYLKKAFDFVVSYSPRFAGAIAILILGLWIIRIITSGIIRMMDKGKMDDSLKPFFKSLIGTTLKILLFISVLSMIGVQMTSFIALLGAAGLAIGLALSGTLQNFAGGVIILILRPFNVGDYIEAQGFSGSVNAIQIFNTFLKTPDNKVIIIPNGPLSSGSIVNYSAQENRRVEWTFSIAYGDDSDTAKDVLKGLINSESRILPDPEPFVALSALADSSVNFVVRVWTKREDYWAVFFDMNEKVYKTFEKEGLNIPYPQMDVHLKKK
ncbi:mechanosensitive ion channel family protein [Bacteroidota bacterium]